MPAWSQKNEEKLTEENLLERQKQRLKALLSQERVKTKLKEVAPEHDPADLGAVEAIGYEAVKPAARFTVYFFTTSDSPGLQRAAIKKLLEEFPENQPDIRVLYSTNGPMLFFGHAHTDGPNGLKQKFGLAKLISAFSGDE